MHNTHGNIMNIQRFSTSDGPGIRTTVFLKGCPLRCSWCHNPESQAFPREILFKPDLCAGCRACAAVCPAEGHSFESGHVFIRSTCIGCGQCAGECPTKALEACGEKKTTDEVVSVVLRDRLFYEESGGGVTLSGGEPLAQYDFSKSILKKCKEHGLHTAIETSGFTERSLREISEYVDLWLYDVKLLDEEDHIRHTGVSNRKILENLRSLSASGANIILRCPILPGINMTDEHIGGVAALAESLKGVTAVNLEPYHPLGLSKCEQLGRTQAYENASFLDSEALLPFTERLRSLTKKTVEIV